MAPKNFTQRDMDLMAAAFQSLKTPPEVRTFLPVTSKDVIEANSSARRSTTTSSPRRQATRMQQLPASASWTPRRSCLPMTVTLVSFCGCAFLIFLASLFLCDADALSLDSRSIAPSQTTLSHFVPRFLSTFLTPSHLLLPLICIKLSLGFIIHHLPLIILLHHFSHHRANISQQLAPPSPRNALSPSPTSASSLPPTTPRQPSPAQALLPSSKPP